MRPQDPTRPLVTIDGLAMELDDRLVFGLIAFYFHTPSARAELGTEASRAGTNEFTRP